MECLTQLKESLQIFAAAYREYQLRLLAICSVATYAEPLREAAACKIIVPTMTTHLIPAENVNVDLLLAQPAEFLTALGAAMREVPPW